MGSTIERDIYYRKLPVWLGGNVYFNGAKPADQETDAIVDTEHTVKLELKEENGTWHLDTDLYEYLPKTACAMISTETLGMAFEPEEKFENPDGTPIVFQYDYFGARQESTRFLDRLQRKNPQEKHYKILDAWHNRLRQAADAGRPFIGGYQWQRRIM